MALILLWIGGFCVFAASAIMATPQSEEETTDAIVVLTGGKNRIQEGLSLFAQGRALHLFISGVHEDVKKYEILALWDGDHALPPCCVSLGYEATTTTQNAAETRKWIQKQDYSSIRLVTGDYHMMRSITNRLLCKSVQPIHPRRHIQRKTHGKTWKSKQPA